ncbi:glycosyltransferase family 61 protein [Rhizobium sp. CFBP 8762]|uniref:glycosyltransferase family 61 protein n=1 Tax=Rhizobium sp. CFBP 8762 TaxID=2775279 RepID=UPI0017824C92|nr:glycosyltransferase family 61 protein [Rhizobium sp. CFBP 8762]MBD8555574.1 glycosyltransferase family 61 protein [Rhizobium sp. CFBP 8762]
MPKNLLKDVMEFAAKAEWSNVMSSTNDLNGLLKRPRLFGLRIEASLAMNDVEAVKSTAETAAKATMPPNIRYATIRPLLKAGYASEAWSVLNGDTKIVDDSGYLPQAIRVAKVARKDRLLQLEILRTLKKLHPKIANRRKSALQFLPNTAVYDRKFGRFDALASSDTDIKHLNALKSTCSDSISGLENALPPRAIELLDVFVDSFGQVWSEDGAVAKSYGRPMPVIKPSDCKTVEYAVNGIMATKGVYHWLIDRMPQLGIVPLSDSSNLKILMRDGGPRFELESVKLAGLQDSQIELVSDIVFVKRLLLPSVGFAGLRHWSMTGPMFEQMSANAFAIAARDGFVSPERIYISRRDGLRRPMVNEAELEQSLKERGFSTLLFAEMPLWQKVVVCASAKRIVGPHGAGLSHLIFSQPGTKFLEVLPIMDGTYALRFIYARLSTVLGLDYRAWLEPQPPRTDQWQVRLPEFLPQFDEWLSQA